MTNWITDPDTNNLLNQIAIMTAQVVILEKLGVAPSAIPNDPHCVVQLLMRRAERAQRIVDQNIDRIEHEAEERRAERRARGTA